MLGALARRAAGCSNGELQSVEQGGRRKRLTQVLAVERARAFDHFVGRRRGKDDDGQVGKLLVLTHAFDQVPAALASEQAEVDDRSVRWLAAQAAPGPFDVDREARDETFLLEQVADQRRDVAVVFDDQDFEHWAAPWAELQGTPGFLLISAG